MHDTVLPIADLIDRPGVCRRVDVMLPPPEGLDQQLAHMVAPVRLDGEVASVVEGILVRGVVSARLDLRCARCLVEVEVDLRTEVAERFTDPCGVADLEGLRGAPAEDVIEQGYEIRGGWIDLDTLMRDALVLAVPFQPLCAPGCLGLCPVCGSRRQDVDCNCAQPGTDARWAELEDLRRRLDGVSDGVS